MAAISNNDLIKEVSKPEEGGSGAFLEIEAGGCSIVQEKKWSRAHSARDLRPRIYCGVSFIHPAPPPCSLAAKKYSTLPKKRAAPTILL